MDDWICPLLLVVVMAVVPMALSSPEKATPTMMHDARRFVRASFPGGLSAFQLYQDLHLFSFA
jgi:hypothetical protein